MASSSDPVLSPDLLATSGALLAAQQAIASVIDTEAVAVTGEDPTTVDLLVRLDQAPYGRLRGVDLSRQLLLSPSHISRRVDRAEAAGLVERAPDPVDRRASLVVLTPAGRAIVERFAPALRAVLQRVVFETLTAAEIDQLVSLLNRLDTAARTPITT